MQRKPPQDIDAEQSVLGALLIDNSRHEDITFLKPDDFYRNAHKLIYQAITDLITNNQPADMVTVFNKLGKQADTAGGASYIAQLADLTPTAANCEHYAKIVKNKSLLRGVIEVSNKASYAAYGEEKPPEELIEELTNQLTNINDNGTKELPDIQDLLIKTIEDIQDRKPGCLLGISTGIPELNAWTSGFEKGKLNILAARPAMGKSSLGLQIAARTALIEDLTVAVFTLEMTKEQCIEKIIANQCFIPSSKMRHGTLTDEEIRKMNNFAADLARKKLAIDDSSRLTIPDIKHKCRKIKKKYGSLDLVMVDYIGKMTGEGDNRQQQIGHISWGLKQLAKDLECSVLALSQLNRGVENRENKRPMMSDLRESGDIEQDSDLIMFLYRDEYYNPDTDKPGQAELIISKQRVGKTGTINLVWLGEYQRFVSIEKE